MCKVSSCYSSAAATQNHGIWLNGDHCFLWFPLGEKTTKTKTSLYYSELVQRTFGHPRGKKVFILLPSSTCTAYSQVAHTCWWEPRIICRFSSQHLQKLRKHCYVEGSMSPCAVIPETRIPALWEYWACWHEAFGEEWLFIVKPCLLLGSTLLCSVI